MTAVTPATGKRRRTRHVVCARDELAPGGLRVLQLGKRRILVLCRPDGRYRALANTCPHQGGPLGGGSVERMWVADTAGEYRQSAERAVVVCPWHNFEFDADDGCWATAPGQSGPATYRVEIEDGHVVVYV